MPALSIPRDDEASSPILPLDSFPETGTPKHEKKSGYQLFASLGSPKHVVAPMVDQSELPWRILSRRYDSHLVYTPMINARAYLRRVESNGPKNLPQFWIPKDASKAQEEGQSSIVKDGKVLGTDRPLIAQFAGHDCDGLLAAAQIVEEHCDAVDLNLGCPQDIARRGHYGSFLQSDWQLIFRLINTLHINLRIPVTAKMRVFESTERTVAYAQMMERAGAQIITVHGRTRDMKGHKTGLADWKKIKAVKEAVKVPVFANGNILYHDDVAKALAATGADGVMSAEGNLYNPTLFAAPPKEASELFPLAPTYPFPRITLLIQEYLDICDRLDTPTASSAIKSHLFRLARPALEIHRDLRPVLGKCSLVSTKGLEGVSMSEFYDFLDELSKRLKADEADPKFTSTLSSTTSADHQSVEGEDPPQIPHWLAQPYYRKTLPAADEAVEVKVARREKRALRVEQTEGVTDNDDIQAKADVLIDDNEPAEKRLRILMQEASTLKKSGNAYFERKEFDDAITQYQGVLDLLPTRVSAGNGEEEAEENDRGKADVGAEEGVEEVLSADGEQCTEAEEEGLAEEIRLLRAVVNGNLAACYLAKKEYKDAVVACNEALQDDVLYLKALYRRAQANEEIATWSSLTSALEDYKSINAMPHPASLQTVVDASLRRLPDKIQKTSEKEKEEMMGKLKGIGDSVLGYFGLSTNNFQMQKGEGGGYSLNFVR